MITIFQSNVPRCPKCSALMYSREQDGRRFMICADCLKVYEIINNGQAENELTVTDEDVVSE